MTQISRQPQFLPQSLEIIDVLRKFTLDELADLMNMSEKLARQTSSRIQNFTLPHIPKDAGIALDTFQGDVYTHINSESYSIDDFTFAQQHIRILSGLYGILRPLDLMQPYRLEMGTRLPIRGDKNLYDYWSSMLTENLNEELGNKENKVIVNCASAEYARVINRKMIHGRIITLIFKQQKGGKLKSIAIYAKRARGLFVNEFVLKRYATLDDLVTFNKGGYQFSSDQSSESELVFITNLDQ